MKCSLIITTYNWVEALDLVLESVLHQSVKPEEVVIADDGSDSLTSDLIKKYQAKSNLNIIHSWQEDQGFRAARSRNKAIARVSGEYIILTDGDMILHEQFIEDHIRRAEKGFFIQGSRVLLSKAKSIDVVKRRQVYFSPFESGISNRKNAVRLPVFLSKLLSRRKNYLRGIKTCNMSFYRQDCLRVNGFNESFEGWGREDSEFAVRMLNSGIDRNTVKFNALQYHIWHNENTRATLEKNELLLKQAIDERKVRCNQGINQHINRRGMSES